MTREETIQVLSLLKAAYPNSYRGLTEKEANGVINIWFSQFEQYPVSLLLLAINKLISTLKFPPTVAEAKDKLQEIGGEARTALAEDKCMHHLSDEQRADLRAIVTTCSMIPQEIRITSLVGRRDEPLLEAEYGEKMASKH